MMPLEPIYNRYTDRGNPAFLVEVRSQSGYSGAPVFAYVAGGTRRTIGGSTGSLLTTQGPWLLGILWGYTQVKGEPNEPIRKG